MKINDPKLTAFVLGELNAEESRAVKQAMQNDESIANEIASIQETATLVGTGFANQDLKLNPEQRGEIFTTGSVPSPDNITTFPKANKRNNLLPWATAGIGVAAAIALMVNFTPQSGTPGKNANFASYSINELSEGISLSASPWTLNTKNNTNSEKTHSTSEVSPSQALSQSPSKFRSFLQSQADKSVIPQSGSFQQSSWINTEKQSSTTLPLTSGNLSWNWIQSAIDKQQDIQPSSVRIEEIVNAVNFSFSEDFSVSGVTASVDLVPSPWNDQSVVAVIHIKNTNSTSAQNVSAGISCGDVVKKFRVLGYRDKSNTGLIAPSSYNLEPGYTHTMLCELDFGSAPTSTNSLLTLHLTADQSTQSGNYSFSEVSPDASSPMANYTVALAYWAQWAGKSNIISAQKSDIQAYLQNALSEVSNPESTSIGKKLLSSLK